MGSCDVVIAGLGGQGIVLASRVLMEVALRQGLPVRGAETHGMAQRGGSVLAHVRVGACQSPEVLPGRADLVLALEHHEGIRALPFLGPGGTLAVNAESPELLPLAVRAHLDACGARLLPVPATRLAQEAGDVKALNMVLVGVACGLPGTPFSLETAATALQALVKPSALTASLAALRLGAARA
jgi:indolepyruvate ferredoxin oxidoreductase beta subunit